MLNASIYGEWWMWWSVWSFCCKIHGVMSHTTWIFIDSCHSDMDLPKLRADTSHIHHRHVLLLETIMNMWSRHVVAFLLLTPCNAFVHPSWRPSRHSPFRNVPTHHPHHHRHHVIARPMMMVRDFGLVVKAFHTSGVQKVLELGVVAAIGAALRDKLDAKAVTALLLNALVPAVIVSSLPSRHSIWPSHTHKRGIHFGDPISHLKSDICIDCMSSLHVC